MITFSIVNKDDIQNENARGNMKSKDAEKQKKTLQRRNLMYAVAEYV